MGTEWETRPAPHVDASPLPVLQPSLRVGPSDDPAERQADAVAIEVVARLATTDHSGLPFTADELGRVRRSVRSLLRQAHDTAVPIGPEGGSTDTEISSRIQRSTTGGAPLDAVTSHRMGEAFGADFSRVRVHQDIESERLSQSLGARAFTVGNHVFMGSDAPAIGSPDGDRLLAHELTHTIQQRGATVRRLSAPAGWIRPSASSISSRTELVRRMTIQGVGKGKKKDKEYKVGETITFRNDYAKAKGLGAGEGPFMAVLTPITGIQSYDNFNLIFNQAAKSDGVFVSLDDFVSELTALRRNWGGQKFFYEKPDGANKVNELSAVEGSETTDISLFSAREQLAVENLFLWGRHNGIPMTGDGAYANLVAGDAHSQDAPFHGHFADRAHTVKYGRQKAPHGGRLVCLALTSAASNELREARKDAKNVASDGGEGYVAGGWGMKKEKTFLSVAVGQNKETWKFLESRVARIDFL